MKKYNGEKYIVSYTSFGKRLEKAGRLIYILTKQSYKDFHVVLTIHKDDLVHISETLQLMIDCDLVELLVADIDYGPHLKYYYAMSKYYDKPIITVDDDRFYDSNLIKRLVEKYESIEYKSIVANCAIKMQKDKGRLLPYPYWIKHRLKPNEVSMLAMAEGFAGILYPPKCFANLKDDSYIQGMLSCKYDDDLYLKVQGIKNGVPVTNTNHSESCVENNNMADVMEYNLHNNQNAGDLNRVNMCYKFENDLLKGWDL